MVSYIFFHLFPSAEMPVYPQAGPSGAFVFGPAAASPVSAIPNTSKLTSHCNNNMFGDEHFASCISYTYIRITIWIYSALP